MKVGWRLLLFLFAIGGCRQQQDAVVFSFRYQPGERHTYRIYDDVETETSLNQGTPTRYRRFQVQKSTMTVMSRDSLDVYRLKITFQVESDSLWRLENGEKTLVKRDHPRETRKWIYDLGIRENGEIVHIKGKNEGATFFYERAYKTSQPVFPREPIAPGYSWRQNVAVNMPNNQTFTAITTYTFSGFQNLEEVRCAVIEFVSSLDIDADLTGTEWNRKHHRKWSYRNTTKTTGRIFFDFKKGRMVRKETTFSVKRRSHIVDREGNEKDEFRRTIDRETIKLICVHQDSTLLSSSAKQ